MQVQTASTIAWGWVWAQHAIHSGNSAAGKSKQMKPRQDSAAHSTASASEQQMARVTPTMPWNA